MRKKVFKTGYFADFFSKFSAKSQQRRDFDEFRHGFDACRCKNFEKFVFLSAELHRAAVDRGFGFLSADVLRTRGFGSRLFIYIKTGLRLASLFRLVRQAGIEPAAFTFGVCYSIP